MKIITKEYIRDHSFAKTGFEDSVIENVSTRFAPGMKLPPSDSEKAADLRAALADIILCRTENYSQASAKTGINEETLRAYLRRGRKSRFARFFVAKIVIGFSIPMDEANRLFILQGGALDPTNTLLDAIVVNCIQEHEDIYVFSEMCEEYGIEW